jgi:hypothetical protein
MARPLRIEFAGAVYHVTSRGNERRPIFRTHRDRLTFLRFLGETVERFGWSITAWVLMTNRPRLSGRRRCMQCRRQVGRTARSRSTSDPSAPGVPFSGLMLAV